MAKIDGIDPMTETLKTNRRSSPTRHLTVPSDRIRLPLCGESGNADGWASETLRDVPAKYVCADCVDLMLGRFFRSVMVVEVPWYDCGTVFFVSINGVQANSPCPTREDADRHAAQHREHFRKQAATAAARLGRTVSA
jgi:hypothetical protein